MFITKMQCQIGLLSYWPCSFRVCTVPKIVYIICHKYSDPFWSGGVKFHFPYILELRLKKKKVLQLTSNHISLRWVLEFHLLSFNCVGTHSLRPYFDVIMWDNVSVLCTCFPAHQDSTSVEPGELLRTTLHEGLWTGGQKTRVPVPDLQLTEAGLNHLASETSVSCT